MSLLFGSYKKCEFIKTKLLLWLARCILPIPEALKVQDDLYVLNFEIFWEVYCLAQEEPTILVHPSTTYAKMLYYV